VFKRDPVCGRRINRNKAHVTVYYRGEPYHLCCPLCQAMFEREPSRYLLEPAQHGRHARSNRTRKQLARW